MNISIIGGGISGLSCAYHLDIKKFDVKVYEANNSWGGLLDNFTVGDQFVFDHFIHLSFTNNEYVKEIFKKGSESIIHKPVAYNLSNGKWIKHPAQFNLKPLNLIEKLKIFKGFIKRKNLKNPKNYKEWLETSFGEYFTENYPGKYTKKYWTLPPEELSTDWLSVRFKIPSLLEIIKGFFIDINQNHYYAKEMRYPFKGGYKSYLNFLAKDLNILLNKKVIEIDLIKKTIMFSDGSKEHFDKIVSTIPLPELIKVIKDVPVEVIEASKKLIATSAQLVSFGFNKYIKQHLWFYIYDEDFLPSRAWSPSEKSKNNVKSGKSSIQFETYYSKLKPKSLEKDQLIDHIIEKSEKFNLFKKNDIECVDFREIKYANVIFDHNRKINLKIIHDFLIKKNVEFCGRFGEWNYLWSDQAFLSGKKISKKLNKL